MVILKNKKTTPAFIASYNSLAMSSATDAANQYLKPDFSNPITNELDPNSSPLALLAKTCSQIGVDTSNLDSTNKKSFKGKRRGIKTAVNTSASQSSFWRDTEQRLNPNFRNGTRLHTASQIPLLNAIQSNVETTRSSRDVKNTPRQHEKVSSISLEDIAIGGNRQRGLQPNQLALENAHMALLMHHSTSSNLFTSSIFDTSSSENKPMTSTELPINRLTFRDPSCLVSLTSRMNQQLLDTEKAMATDYSHLLLSRYVMEAMMTTAGAKNGLAASTGHSRSKGGYLPYICNWLLGTANYCGKLFTNNEELLSHLKTHIHLPTFLPRPESSFSLSGSTLSSSCLTPSARHHPYARTLSALTPTSCSPVLPPLFTLDSSYLNPDAALFSKSLLL